MIAIVDYDTGNLCSVCNALGRLGVQYVVTDDAETIKKADKVLLPEWARHPRQWKNYANAASARLLKASHSL